MKESRGEPTFVTGSALKTQDEMQTLPYTAAGFSSPIPLQMKQQQHFLTNPSLIFDLKIFVSAQVLSFK